MPNYPWAWYMPNYPWAWYWNPNCSPVYSCEYEWVNEACCINCFFQNRKAVYKKRSIYHLKHVGCCSKAQHLIWSQMFSASTDFQENCGRLQMLMTKAITRRLFNAALPERCQQPPATAHQPVREYTLFPSNWRLPGSHCPVSRCLWESLKVNPS